MSDQRTGGLRAVLSLPAIYSTFQKILGSDQFLIEIVNLLRLGPRQRVLDIGCGTADILEFLPEDTEYVGYDLSARYIESAKKKYGNRGEFYCKSIDEMELGQEDLYDIVLGIGVLHHVDDELARELFQVGRAALADEGVMITVDNTIHDGQSSIARYVSSKDRGRHVRSPSAYEKLALSSFTDVECNVYENMLRIPLSMCVLKCSA